MDLVAGTGKAKEREKDKGKTSMVLCVEGRVWAMGGGGRGGVRIRYRKDCWLEFLPKQTYRVLSYCHNITSNVLLL